MNVANLFGLVWKQNQYNQTEFKNVPWILYSYGKVIEFTDSHKSIFFQPSPDEHLFVFSHSVVYFMVGSSNLEHTLSQYYTASIQRKYRLIKKPLGFFLANYFVKSIKPISWMKHVFLTQVLNFDKISCHTHWVIKFRFTAVTVRRRILWGQRYEEQPKSWIVKCLLRKHNWT